MSFNPSTGAEFHLFLHEVVNEGLHAIADRFTVPNWETPRDYENFWFIAHWNVFAAIVNSISLSGHGGTLIISNPNSSISSPSLRIKYGGQFDALRTAFIEFINRRNKTADMYEESEQNDKKIAESIFKEELALSTATEQMIEAVRFVANFASCDGAIVISPDLRVWGFGAEIRAEMETDVNVLNVVSEMPQKYEQCDIEQFGMRHRSAIKLASRDEGALVLAISQDGPISAIWRRNSTVFVKKGVSLANLNMPWTGGA